MFLLLLAVIYLSFISLGLPDCLPGPIAKPITPALFPWYLPAVLVFMTVLHEALLLGSRKGRPSEGAVAQRGSPPIN